MLKILGIFNLIIAVQALFLFLHFLFKVNGVKVLNRLLASLNFCFAVLLINTYLSLYFEEYSSVLLQDLSNNLMWFIGPLLYLYVIYNQKKPDTRVILLHILPYLLPTLFDLIFDFPIYDEIVPFIGFTQMSIYLSLCIRFCYLHYRVESKFYSWALPSIVSFTLLIFLNFVMRVLASFDINLISSQLLQSFTSLLVIPIFYLAYKEMNSESNYGIEAEKYKATPLSEEKINTYLTRITTAVENDKLYRQKNLTLSMLSKTIEIPSKYISQVINLRMKMGFSEYLVKLRIEEVKDNLNNPDKKHLTITGIADEAGFASSSRFNLLFKKHTGLTPSQFLNEQK